MLGRESPMAGGEAGKWYLAVECRNPKCRRGIVFQEAPDDPTEDVAVPEKIPLSCPHCGRSDIFRPFDVRRVQAPM
jgi:hypothetical protein